MGLLSDAARKPYVVIIDGSTVVFPWLFQCLCSGYNDYYDYHCYYSMVTSWLHNDYNSSLKLITITINASLINIDYNKAMYKEYYNKH